MVPSENKYLYNGKELQDEQLGGVNLDWYDFDFRMYDPALGRFTCLDPIAESFYHVSPYNYAENSPIANIDLWGLQAEYYLTRHKRAELLTNSKEEYIKELKRFNRDDRVVTAGAAATVGISSAIGFGGVIIDAIAGWFGGKAATTPEVPDPTPAEPEPASMEPDGGTQGTENTGRGKNKMTPSEEAEGPHSTFKKDSEGNTTGYETYEENPQNPTGYDTKKRYDGEGKGHYNKKTGEVVKTPHVHEGGEARKPKEEEIPKTNKR